MYQHASRHSGVERLRLASAKDLGVNVAQRDVVMLLVGKPGHLRDALQSLIGVAPGLDRLVTADTGLLALKVMREYRPSLVLVASDLPEAEVVELLQQIKEAWPETGCLVLTDSAQGRRQSLAAGADYVLSAGLSAGQLFSTIQHMLEDSSQPKS
jgi:DNA-binding NarL/FixJ family response regulator